LLLQHKIKEKQIKDVKILFILLLYGSIFLKEVRQMKLRLNIFITALMLCFMLASGVYAETNPSDILDAQIKEAEKTVQVIQPEKVMDWIVAKKDFVLVDVRERAEVEAGKIEYKTYTNIPRGFLDIVAAKGALKIDDIIVVYCKKGSRGLLAAAALKKLGFKNVYNIKDGIHGWMEAGLPITNSLGTFKTVPYELTGCAEDK